MLQLAFDCQGLILRPWCSDSLRLVVKQAQSCWPSLNEGILFSSKQAACVPCRYLCFAVQCSCWVRLHESLCRHLEHHPFGGGPLCARKHPSVCARQKIILEQSIRFAEIDRRVAVTLRILPKTMNSLTVALVSRRLVVVTVAPYPSNLNN